MLPFVVQQAHDKALEVWPELSRFATGVWAASKDINGAFETDGGQIRYNTKVIEQMTPDDAAFAVAHTLLHVGFLHRQRREDRDEKKWHTACDIVVNHTLQERMELPEGAVYDPKYAGLSADEVYDKLPADDGKNSPEEGEGKGKGLGIGGLSSDDSEGAEGGYTKTSAEAAREAAGDSEKIMEVAGKLPGKEPMAVLRDIQTRRSRALAKLRPNWMQGVAQTMRLKIGTSVMDRRFFAEEMYLDNFDEEDVVLIAVDTSGSVSDHMVKVFLQLIQGLLEELQAKATVLMVDTEIHSVTELEPGDALPRVVGRGGTDFRPVIEFANAAPNGRYQMAFYFTDAYGEFGKVLPAIPFTWVLWPGSSRVPAGFGDTIQMDSQYDDDD